MVHGDRFACRIMDGINSIVMSFTVVASQYIGTILSRRREANSFHPPGALVKLRAVAIITNPLIMKNMSTPIAPVRHICISGFRRSCV